MIALSVALACAPLQAATPEQQALHERLDRLQQQLAEQKRQLEALRQQLTAQQTAQQQAAQQQMAQQQMAQQQGAGARGAWPNDALAERRGAGTGVAANSAQSGSGSGQPPSGGAGPATTRAGAGGTASAAGSAASSAAAPAAAPASAAVGQPPPTDGRPPEVAPIFEQPGVLTPRGKYVLEPSAQFAYSSSNRIALVGYTIIPALLIGLVDVREVKRNTSTGALTGRYGLTRRLELEAKLPYVYRSDATVSREIFTGTSTEKVFDTSGKGIGDVELALRYQINNGGVDKPYYVGGLRLKTRTGQDPFGVVTDCSKRCIGPDATGTGLPLELPTGSGFYALQPSLTWLFPSDPAIFFGSVSYLHNFKRHGVMRQIMNGEREPLGTIAPGGVIGFNFGMGLALNDKAALSLGYDHNSIARTRQNGVTVPGSVRTQLGTLLLGLSYRFSPQRTLNIAVGAGLTRDTPDLQLSLRLPMTF